MDDRKLLVQRLLEYHNTEVYPFHMPGHKRCGSFPNPFTIDITEISGFDNLHYPEGILKESMNWAANIYQSDQTYYLVNGSSCGILAAISAAVPCGGKILISRNCHKSIYHGIFLNHLESEYVYPQIIEDYDIHGGLSAKDIGVMLKKHLDIKAVLIVSPTYEGVVSDIKAISEIVHQYRIPLIVDEAHGAHFNYSKNYPQMALSLGADLVIQSVHKTLPSLTQTALLHLKSVYIDKSKLEFYLSIYQSSSPSYLFLASIESCIDIMQKNGEEKLDHLFIQLKEFHIKMKKLKNLKLMGFEVVEKDNVKDFDLSKVVISTKKSSISGIELYKWLKNEYQIEMEMSGFNYVVGILTVCDKKEGLIRLAKAILEIDQKIGGAIKKSYQLPQYPEKKFSIFMASQLEGERVLLKQCQGKASKEYMYLYPPGIPIIVPGEIITKEILEQIIILKQEGYSVEGAEDKTLKYLSVVKDS